MDTIKKIIITIGILVILLIITLIIILIITNKNSATDYDSNTEFEQQILYEPNNNIEKESNRNQYYAVKSIAEKYMKSLNNLKESNINDNANAIYSILDKQYIEEFNITEANTKDKLNIYTDNEKIYINNMYTLEKSNSIKIYFIYGTTINTSEQIKLLVKTDSKNNTFSIFPQEYMDKYGYNEQSNVESINISQDEILPNQYNTFKYINISDEQMSIYYFEDFKNKVFEENGLYNILDEEYRQKKFASTEEYNSYLTDLKEDVISRNIVKYDINKKDGYNEYILIDQENKYYIFKENAVMDYTLILDTYTIDLPQFTEKYNKSNDADKAGMNLQKITDAINDKDYKYVYNKLDETFKQNNFETQLDFENYCKSVFYTNNDIEFSNYQNSGALHMFDAKFTNKDNNTQSITKTFIIKLLEGTDFVMSFNVN